MIMGKLAKGLFPVNALLLLGLFACTTPIDAGMKNSKFYLVYLISTDKVQPGAKAFVEPLFFTDGEKVESLYAYCRGLYHQGDSNTAGKFPQIPDPTRIGDDLAALHDYCSNKSVTLTGKNYFSSNNMGVSIRLDKISFTGDGIPDSNDPHVLAPRLPELGTAVIGSVSGQVQLSMPEMSPNVGLQYFFLMSANKALLERIVPRSRPTADEINTLLKRSRAHTNDQRGISYWTKPVGRGRARGFDEAQTYVVAPLFGDLDGDGTVDLVVGMRSSTVTQKDDANQSRRVVWTGIGFVYAEGQFRHISNVYREEHVSEVQARGISVGTPFVLIRMGECRYVVSHPHVYTSPVYYLLPSRMTGDCEQVRLQKRIDPTIATESQ